MNFNDFFFFTERMAVNLKEERKMESVEIKEEIQDPSSSDEDTRAVYIHEEDVKVEVTETQGK